MSTPRANCCHHILANGKRCGAAALRHEQFCFYHHPTRRPPSRKPDPKPASNTFSIPALNSATAIQIALSHVALRVANGTLDLHRANLILGVLQIARANLAAANDVGHTPAPISHSSHSGDLEADLAGILAILGSPSTTADSPAGALNPRQHTLPLRQRNAWTAVPPRSLVFQTHPPPRNEDIRSAICQEVRAQTSPSKNR